MSVRHLFNSLGLVRRHITISPIAPRLQPVFPTANSLLSRSYAAPPGKLPRNRDIAKLCREVNFVDAEGKFHGVKNVETLLSMIDSEIYQLICINPHVIPDIPTCKLISTEDLKERERALYEAKKAKKQNDKDPAKVIKRIEISWATAPNDFDHKMKKVTEFLQKGNRVEIALGVKKGMAKQPLGKMAELVMRIKDQTEMDGKEWKPPEGKIGVQYVIYLEGERVKKAAVGEVRPVRQRRVRGETKVEGEAKATDETEVGEETRTAEETMDAEETIGLREAEAVDETKAAEETKAGS